MILEFLLEEQSMEECLKILLPKILPEQFQYRENYFLRPHQGKSDLLNSIPRKMKTEVNRREDVRFIILHDCDSWDCKKLKEKIIDVIKSKIKEPPIYLIRIVCRELESWYLGDLKAVEKARLSNFKSCKYINKARFRNPDNLEAAEELSKMLSGAGRTSKISWAKSITPHLSLENNKSRSFQQFVSGLKRFVSND